MGKVQGKIWDLEGLKADLDSAEVEDVDGVQMRSVYLGTVFNLLPSGKYYNGVAHSNLTPCSRCKGAGTGKKEYTCESCDGSGVRKSSAHSGLREFKPIDVTCTTCNGTGKVHKECVLCGGLGSQEARKDEKWVERAELELESIGATLEAGEGDPCDLFARVPVPDEYESDADYTDIEEALRKGAKSWLRKDTRRTP